MSLDRLQLSIFGAAAIVVVACGSTGEPEPQPAGAVSGVYDFAATLDSVDYEVPATSPTQCPSSGMYCTYKREFSGASLSGVITLSLADGTLSATGELTGMFCDNFDVSGCLGVAPLNGHYVDYGSAIQAVGADSTISASIVSTALVGLRATLRGDSLEGTVEWRKSLTGRYPPRHTGNFVARRRPR
jgi:hypothetical protein